MKIGGAEVVSLLLTDAICFVAVACKYTIVAMIMFRLDPIFCCFCFEEMFSIKSFRDGSGFMTGDVAEGAGVIDVKGSSAIVVLSWLCFESRDHSWDIAFELIATDSPGWR